MITIRLDADMPLAEQVAAGVRGAIARGELRPGDPLPTVRQLASDLGINLNTVSRAYQALAAMGLLTTVRGRGTVVAAARENPRASARSELSARLREWLDDARLAGLERPAIRQLFLDQLER